MAMDSINKARELELKQQEILVKHKDIDTKASTERYKADVTLKVAKENKQKGEK